MASFNIVLSFAELYEYGQVRKHYTLSLRLFPEKIQRYFQDPSNNQRTLWQLVFSWFRTIWRPDSYAEIAQTYVMQMRKDSKWYFGKAR